MDWGRVGGCLGVWVVSGACCTGRIGEELVAVILWMRVRRKYEFRCHGRTDTRMGSKRYFAYRSVSVAVWYGSRLLACSNLLLSILRSVVQAGCIIARDAWIRV